MIIQPKPFGVKVDVWGCKIVNSTRKAIFDVFFREKPAMMLVELKNADSNVYASVLAKQIDCTYSHVVKILQEMQKADLIKFKKEGRLKLLELTKKGNEIASNIESIKTML
jgi:predicted transcriptional regulator